jgi:hypothetical protein
VNKEISLRFHMEVFNLEKFNNAVGREKYCVEVSKRIAA